MKSQPIRSKPSWRSAKMIAAGVAAVIVLAGCASTSAGTNQTGSFKEVKQSSSSAITVWVDATRLPEAQAYKKAHPSAKIDLVTYDPTTFQTKISLFDKAGSGWPDVVFSAVTTDVGWATSGKDPFAAPLNKGIFPASKIKNFAAGALDPCMVDGTLYCIRNDLAQNVLWYNKTLFDKFGYTVPTTWEQYEALGAKVAKEHPGYILGSVGDSNVPEIYFWGAKCPANKLTGNTFSSDLSSPNCTKMADLLDNMVANGSVTKDPVFGTSFPAQHGAKTLALVGPSFEGQYVFGSSLKTPAGQIAAANPLSWDGEAPATGNAGGGLWYVSSHSKNLKAASDFVNWMTTSDANQASAPTYPAYAPAAKAWLSNPANTSYFATDVTPAFTKAASEVWSGWSSTSRADPGVSWAANIVPALLTGKTIKEELPAWQTQILNLAGTVGYKVSK
jgi:ABC-type glycerol-3-phosphate transport system substrate-binding protein